MNGKLIEIVSDNSFISMVGKKKMKAYLGIDPTAEGIHLGHLLPISLLIELLKNNCEVIILIGGFTASIGGGDPTDKMQARAKQEEEKVSQFSTGILKDMKAIFKKYGSKVKFVNNKQWLSKTKLSDILEIGYKISVNRQVTMDTFKRRLETQSSISLTEFLYPELQFLDFLHLNKKYGCNIQVGGQDQWGNIAFGVHYVKACTGKDDIYGISTPLLTSSGKKLGKSEGATFIKDTNKFYHFCLQLEDDVARSAESIFNLKHFEDPIDQKKEICRYAFRLMFKDGDKVFSDEESKAQKLFKGSLKDADEKDFVVVEEKKLSKILVLLKACKTRGDAINQIQQGAILIDEEKISEDAEMKKKQFKLSVGKKKHFFVKIKI